MQSLFFSTHLQIGNYGKKKHDTDSKIRKHKGRDKERKNKRKRDKEKEKEQGKKGIKAKKQKEI